MHQDPGERSSDPTRDWPRLACECPEVSGRDLGQWWPAAGSGALSAPVHAWNLFKEVIFITITFTTYHYLPYLHHNLASGQTTGREHRPTHQQKIGLRPRFPLSLSHQEASIASYPYPLGARQNENHNHRKLTYLITRTKALSNSVKLWVMPCRSTQDRQVMVENSGKMWSTGEGNGKPLQHSCLENPMNSMKRQTFITVKDEPPGQ